MGKVEVLIIAVSDVGVIAIFVLFFGFAGGKFHFLPVQEIASPGYEIEHLQKLPLVAVKILIDQFYSIVHLNRRAVTIGRHEVGH
jgi:hypothetical protein